MVGEYVGGGGKSYSWRRGIERREVFHLADWRRRVRGPEIGTRGTAN